MSVAFDQWAWAWACMGKGAVMHAVSSDDDGVHAATHFSDLCMSHLVSQANPFFINCIPAD
jgi:hypothetical protein